MKYVFLEEMSGIGKNSNRPYNLLKLACPNTFQNHTISYDPRKVSPESINYSQGDLVEINGVLNTPFNNTGFVCTSIKKAV